ncbi:hypothetical protein FDA94_26335 [Herbidospora galbida]|uniref:Uncharacterized protein n=1 Tax=Herbidospora galbida TaxID=2575442 RepID=A0A4U3MC50_9ACTN|nr:hypothetical protein [Herbidospora galbida]TKK85196.1 hypothetical protein FDA94_26335 [Herbidospora galbida]
MGRVLVALGLLCGFVVVVVAQPAGLVLGLRGLPPVASSPDYALIILLLLGFTAPWSPLWSSAGDRGTRSSVAV